MKSATPLRLEVRAADGTLLTGRAVTWTSSAPGVATIAANGTVSALALGTTTVTATVEGRQGEAIVRSVPQLRFNTVFPSAVTRDSFPLTARAVDASGVVEVSPSPTVAWTSRAPGIATVSPSGMVQALASGSVWLIAEAAGKRDSVRFVAIRRARTVDGWITVRMGPPGDTYPGLWLLRSDGSGLRRVTPGTDQVSDFRWAMDGSALLTSRVSFAGGAAVFITELVDPEGGVAQNLRAQVISPRLSPDNSLIAYRNLTYGADVRPTFGGTATRLGLGVGMDATSPEWSPDGRRIAVVRLDGPTGVWVVTPDGSDPWRPTNLASIWYGRWSPGGRWFAYQSFPNGPGWSGVFVHDFATGETRPVSPNCDAQGLCSSPTHQLRWWTPDGRIGMRVEGTTTVVHFDPLTLETTTELVSCAGASSFEVLERMPSGAYLGRIEQLTEPRPQQLVLVRPEAGTCTELTEPGFVVDARTFEPNRSSAAAQWLPE